MNDEKQLPILCDNLRHLRIRHGLSKREMARILGIGVKTLTAVEEHHPSPRLSSCVLYNAGV